MHCAPHRENQKLTCYSKDSLISIAKTYNNTNPKKKIIVSGKNKLQLWYQIRNALSDRCDNEICWLNQNLVEDKKKIAFETFRPKMPNSWKKDPTTWLTTNDINSVLTQYEKLHKDFFFVGAVPLDCGIGSELQCQLTNFDIKKLYKSGVRKVGVVYNSDSSNGPGQHWMALIVDMTRKNIIFYDSYAGTPLREIMDTMKRFQKDLGEIGLKMKIDYNKKKVQYDEFNCGIYSVNFILNVLKGKSLKQIEKMKIPTEKMQKLKKYLYRNK